MLGVRHLDIVVSFVLVGFGIWVVATGLDYGLMDFGSPGAGFFPLIIGSGIALFAAINTVNAIRRTDVVERIAGSEIARVALCTLAICVFAGVAGVIGMLLAGFVLMLIVAFVFGVHSRREAVKSTAVAALMSGVLYVVFVQLLGVPLP